MTERLFPQPPSLTERQQTVYIYMGEPRTAFQAGAHLHEVQDCRWCRLGGGWGSCDYAERDGRQVLEALRLKGLVRRDIHRVYTRIDVAVPNAQGDFPDGY